MPPKKPLYIAFEGGEAAGKSTQARMLASKAKGVLTREPGKTKLGEQIRSLLLHSRVEDFKIDPMAEVYLMAADRAQHMEEVVRPSLATSQHVIADRSFISSIAYQGAGRELGIELVRDINLMNPKLIMPDIVVLMAPPSEEELARRMGGYLDRFESAGLAFHARLTECFGQMANTLASDSRTSQIKIIDIHQDTLDKPRDVDDIHEEITGRLAEVCSEMRVVSPV